MAFTEGFPLIPLLIAVLLAAHGLRKKSLSPSGALAALVVGFIMMSARVRTFGVSLIVFYLVGSRATKIGQLTKATLEEGHQEAGYRTAEQVLCNSFSAFLATLLWIALFVPGSYLAQILPQGIVFQEEPYSQNVWCPLSVSHGHGWSRFLLLVSLGHFACCLGDTLASELGILSKSPPILITTLARVPPGTNGGVSILGTAASASGGAIMGLTMAISLAMESSACRENVIGLLVELTIVGAAAGLFGSLIDSLMGATIQRTRYSKKTKRILQDETPAPVSSSDEIQVVSGFDLLTNNQVNLVSSIIIALATGYLA
ncbi:uncharacterized protein FOMMEDRAFT_22321 [Fomitiporia mediterranea MF3/22]|uniref:uncharacterized protein n=1 Tax=Fomitiporia mediterranea (strain MF3/22) TaxID=694068 RepID=UPI00044072C3|nr:uncharacterized protein FOMMEDRAFT_22321 [Fomitiporia mediterranea MF3/22]EJD00546.1 hypothetical protein FOMMEDRAFT_22321 [Fomitiporia mediterranea MF3/22]